MSLNHSIHLNSIKNARELGGYITADGRRIKNGVLLRTAYLNGISDEDVRQLREVYRVQHIIDFRMEMEMVGTEDPTIGGARYHHLNVIDPSTFPDREDEDVDVGALGLAQSVAMSEQIGAFDGRMYIGFLSNSSGRQAYADFFRILLSADPDRAVLWHCTSGKDRTGLAAMLLLSALGVDEEVVIEDYMLTNTYNAKRIEKARQMLKEQGFDDAFIEKAILVLDAISERTMRTAIAYLKKEYGSVVGYIRDGLKINQEEIDSLKEKYLIKSLQGEI
ncbi:MAG: tyrosine-protein phosphatase [Ruminococcus sp.]|nr:tyrosine-protein phosphatase [Ruminococcus sp.]